MKTIETSPTAALRAALPVLQPGVPSHITLASIVLKSLSGHEGVSSPDFKRGVLELARTYLGVPHPHKRPSLTMRSYVVRNGKAHLVPQVFTPRRHLRIGKDSVVHSAAKKAISASSAEELSARRGQRRGSSEACFV